MNGNGTQPFAAERGCMVEQQLRQRGISDERLLAAMAKVPRHEFVSEQNWAEAYADHPVPIAEQHAGLAIAVAGNHVRMVDVDSVAKFVF